jgi:hypothetical protein
MTIPTRLLQRDLRGPVDGRTLARLTSGRNAAPDAGGWRDTEDLCEVEEDGCLREL